jgi:hypothetical protein
LKWERKKAGKGDGERMEEDWSGERDDVLAEDCGPVV